MTLQSRKKHLITALKFTRAKRASIFALLVACAGGVNLGVVVNLGVGEASAQETMRPVPRFSGTSVRDTRSESQKVAAKSNLQWRVSSEIAPQLEPAQPQAAPQQLAPQQLARQQSTAPQAARIGSTTDETSVRFVQPAHVAAPIQPRTAISPVLQARYQNAMQLPGDVGSLQLPADTGGLQLPPMLQTPMLQTPPLNPPTRPAQDTVEPLPDFFTDPFGDGTPTPKATPKPRPATPALPKPNDLRPPSTLLEPIVPPNDVDELPMPVIPPKKTVPDAELKSPSDKPANPFDSSRTAEEKAADGKDKKRLEDFELAPSPNRTPEKNPRTAREDEEFKRPAEFSCDKFRKSIAAETIQRVSLDISPPFRPDVLELDEYEKMKTKFNEGQEVRDWQSIDGRKLGRGRLVDLAYEKVVIETEFGTTEQIPINRISEADLAFLSKNWGLPQECLIEQKTYEPRAWQHAKVTWKASNLCHKPLYFEEVNLERYGHTAGPFIQPIVSSAHFFANIAVLPYKMGVHQPSECQYTLGYYRPGNCAPWICPPVPISLRGGLYQAAFMTGAFWLIP